MFVVGAILVGLFCALIALFTSRLKATISRWFATLVIPFLIAYSLYWYPVWLGSDSSEYSAWALLVVTPWFMSGAATSIVVTLIVRRYVAGKTKATA